MPWVKMRFRDQRVWVNADEAGRPILDADGRAEMKYRPTDQKAYRPSPGNLKPDDGSEPDPAPRAAASSELSPPRAAAPRRRKPSAAPGALPEGALEVWTDGACSGNPGPAGIGVVVINGDTRREVSEYLGIGTNNIAELTAIQRGLEVAEQVTGGDRSRRIRIYSDSSYSIGLLDKGWKAKANQQLVERLRRLVATFPNAEFVKVSGHAGVPENERCDELARAAIRRRA